MIASLSNDDGDVNENGKRAVGLHRGGSRGRVQGVFYAHGASMAKSQIGVNRCLQTVKHGLRKSVRPSSFQKAQLQSVSIFFKFVDCLAPFAFAVLFSYYEQLFSCCTQFCDGSLCLSFDNFVAQLL